MFNVDLCANFTDFYITKISLASSEQYFEHKNDVVHGNMQNSRDIAQCVNVVFTGFKNISKGLNVKMMKMECVLMLKNKLKEKG